MEDRDYRSEVGKKIEEALKVGDFDLIEDLIEVPPMETFMQWEEKGEEKRKKRILRKRILVSCLAIVVVSASVLIGLKCFALPEVTADPEEKIGIDITDMDSVETYEAWRDLPEEIQNQFIEVKGLPEDYKIEKIEVVYSEFADKIATFVVKNNYNYEVRQYINADGVLPTRTLATSNNEITIDDIVIYVEKHEQYETITYKYVVRNITIDIIASSHAPIEDIENIIKAVQ